MPSWGHLFDFGYGFTMVFENSCQEATWTDLGSIWAPKRFQNGGRGGSKSELSWVELSGIKLSEVEVSFVVRKGG